MTADEKHPAEDWEYDSTDEHECSECGGDGYIMACDGDPGDWGEDTYCGPDDATITCRNCRGSGYAV